MAHSFPLTATHMYDVANVFLHTHTQTPKNKKNHENQKFLDFYLHLFWFRKDLEI